VLLSDAVFAVVYCVYTSLAALLVADSGPVYRVDHHNNADIREVYNLMEHYPHSQNDRMHASQTKKAKTTVCVVMVCEYTSLS
jgi:hypothetical protein